jgi:5'(3')-deoxyribonucleotidase
MNKKPGDEKDSQGVEPFFMFQSFLAWKTQILFPFKDVSGRKQKRVFIPEEESKFANINKHPKFYRSKRCGIVQSDVLDHLFSHVI